MISPTNASIIPANSLYFNYSYNIKYDAIDMKNGLVFVIIWKMLIGKYPTPYVIDTNAIIPIKLRNIINLPKWDGNSRG